MLAALAFVVVLAVIALGFYAVKNKGSFRLRASLLKLCSFSVEIDPPTKPEEPPAESKPESDHV